MDSEEFTNGEDEFVRLVRENEALPPDLELPVCDQPDVVYKMQINFIKEWNKKQPIDDYSNERFRKEMRNQGVDFYMSDSDFNQFLKPIHYTCPLLLDVKETFREFNKKRFEDKQIQSKSKSSNTPTISTVAADSSSSVSPPPVKKPKIVMNNPVIDIDQIQNFSEDEPEIVDVRVNIGGKNKKVKAFLQDGKQLLIPCSEKNCQHKHMDVSVLPNTGSPPTENVDEFEQEENECEEYLLPLSVGADVSIIEEDSQPLQLNDTIPQITSVQSLAPSIPSRLIPLASQLPNPNRGNLSSQTNLMITRSAIQVRANWDRLRSNPLGNMTIGSVRPTILSKTGHQTITPEFILAQIPPQIHINRRNMRRSTTTKSKTPPPSASNSTIVINNLTERGAINQVVSQVQKQQKNNLTQDTASHNKIDENGAGEISNTKEKELDGFNILQLDEMEEGSSLKIDSVYSTVSEANNAMETLDITQEKEDTEMEVEIIGSKSKDDETSDNNSGPASFNIATNIFEEDDNEGEEEMDDDVPKIVSTIGNATMPPPTTAGVNLTNLAKVARKARYPEKRTISGTQYVVCRTCNKRFPSNCLQLYRNHMKIQHSIEIHPFVAGKDKNDIPGSVGQVVRVGATKVRQVSMRNILNATGVNNLYKCKTCDQLLRKSEILEHVSTCCPGANLNAAFEIVNPATTKPIAPSVFCGLCDSVFASTPELRNHLVRQHNEHAHKMILEPMCRCSNCLTVFEDSIHLGAHVVGCNARKVASGNIMLDLARAMLKCGVCKVSHNNISQTQECYTKAGFIRCLLCLHTVESRGNFFSHMKSYHAREGGRGIRCSFCEVGEQLNFRDLFIHVLENHYNPILQLHSSNSSVLALRNKGLATPVVVIPPSTPSSASQILNQAKINARLLNVSQSATIGFRTLNPNVTTTAVLRRMGTPIPIQVPGFRPILPVPSSIPGKLPELRPLTDIRGFIRPIRPAQVRKIVGADGGVVFVPIQQTQGNNSNSTPRVQQLPVKLLPKPTTNSS